MVDEMLRQITTRLKIGLRRSPASWIWAIACQIGRKAVAQEEEHFDLGVRPLHGVDTPACAVEWCPERGGGRRINPATSIGELIWCIGEAVVGNNTTGAAITVD